MQNSFQRIVIPSSLKSDLPFSRLRAKYREVSKAVQNGPLSSFYGSAMPRMGREKYHLRNELPFRTRILPSRDDSQKGSEAHCMRITWRLQKGLTDGKRR